MDVLFFLLLKLLSSNSGIYFGEPRGFGVNEKGEEIGFNTEVYSVSQVFLYL